jgi:hypothetical protein
MSPQNSNQHPNASADPQTAAQGSRPLFILFLVCSLAVVAIGIRWYSHRLSSAEPVVKPAETAQAAPVRPAVVVASPAPAKAKPPVEVGPPSPVETEWGIRVSSIAVTDEGASVDLRYLVVTQDKALMLAQGVSAAYIEDQASGEKVHLFTPLSPENTPPGVRSRTMIRMARQGGAFPPSPNRLVQGKTNSVLLPNTAGRVRTGNKVILVVGNFRSDPVVVQ